MAGPPQLPPISVGPVDMSHVTEKLEVCPYNPAHTILRYRMQTHLHKCRKNYETSDYGICSHNATHQLPRQELQYHENNLCPDRHSFHAKQYKFEVGPQLTTPVHHIDLPEPTENWDDGQVNTFDPKRNAEEKSMIRGTHCVPPSERKAFKLQHRRRVREREEEEEAQGPVKTEPKTEYKPEEKPVPLRLPKELPTRFSWGRGLKSVQSEEMPVCPQGLDSFPKLSLDSPKEDTSAFVPKEQNGEWISAGRGRSISMAASSSGSVPPVSSAWGRGRPKF